MFKASCFLTLTSILAVFEISTQPFALCRTTAPPAYLENLTRTPLPTESKPGLTPEKSLDIVEKILQGELQPVINAPDLKYEAPVSVVLPDATSRQGIGIVDTVNLLYEPDVSNIVPEEVSTIVQRNPPEVDPKFYLTASSDIPVSPISVFPTFVVRQGPAIAENPREVDPSLYQIGNADIPDFPETLNSATATDEPIQEEPSISMQLLNSQFGNYPAPLITQDYPVQSTQDIKDSPKPIDTGIISDISTLPGNAVSPVSVYRPALEGVETPEDPDLQPTDDTQRSVFQDFPAKSTQDAQYVPGFVGSGSMDDMIGNVARTVSIAEPIFEEITPVELTDYQPSNDNSSSVTQDLPAQSTQDAQYVPGLVGSSSIDDMPGRSGNVALAVPNAGPILEGISPVELTDFQSSNDNNSSVTRDLTAQSTQDAQYRPGLVSSGSMDDMIDPSGNVARTVSIAEPIFEEITPVELTDYQPSNDKSSSVSQDLPAKSIKNVQVTHGSVYGGIQNDKSSKMYFGNLGDVNSIPNESFITPPLLEKGNTPSKGNDKSLENLGIDSKIYFPEERSQSDFEINPLSLKEMVHAHQPVFVKKSFRDFRNVDTDLLAVSDVIYSKSDSKSSDYPSLSSEEIDSDEGDEFWKKMKIFIDNKPLDYAEIQPLGFQSVDLTLPREIRESGGTEKPVNSLGENYFIPNVTGIIPTEVEDSHTMKNFYSKTFEIPSDKGGNVLENRAENVEDINLRRSGSIPVEEVEESPAINTDNENLTNEVTTTKDESFCTENFDEKLRGIDYYHPEGSTTTELSVNGIDSTTEQPDYGDPSPILESDMSTDNEMDKKFDKMGEDATNSEARNLTDVFDEHRNFLKDQNFREDSKERPTGDNNISSGRDLLPGNVGGPDNVRQLENNQVLPQDDPRFREGAAEIFTTDEPLVAEEISFVELTTTLPAFLDDEDVENYLIDLEAESRIPPSNNPEHCVSKKDDPLNTLEDDPNNVFSDDKFFNGPASFNSDVLPIPFNNLESSPHLEDVPKTENVNNMKRIRRSNIEETLESDRNKVNDFASVSYPVSSTAVILPTSSADTKSISPNVNLSTPTIAASISPVNNKEKQLASNTPRSPAPSTLPQSPAAPSIASQTPAPSSTKIPFPPPTTPTTTAPYAVSTTLARSTTSTTLNPATHFEFLPTPIPQTVTTITSLKSTSVPTNSTAPKKKKKKVWKIPFYPNNVAITSSGEVRLEPKDKSAPLPAIITPKPLLSDRLKQEDLEKARERLLRRFPFRRPSTIPILDTAQQEISRFRRMGPPSTKVPTDSANRSSTVVHTVVPSTRPLVSEDVLAYVTAQNPSQLPSLLYNSPEEREEARRRRLRTMVGLAGDVRSFFSDRARQAARTVGKIVVGGGGRGEEQKSSQ